jgi:hypothetical protein|tara:strand:+ start:8717 stop:9016 length:300 start_codon:yes stop_codon:yes gene_type:complete
MDNKAEHKFLPFYVRAGQFDWIKMERSGKLEEIITFYESLRDKDANGNPVKSKDKWVNTQVKTSRKTGKFFEVLVEFEKKPEVKSSEHMPDRVESDLPF